MDGTSAVTQSIFTEEMRKRQQQNGIGLSCRGEIPAAAFAPAATIPPSAITFQYIRWKKWRKLKQDRKKYKSNEKKTSNSLSFE